MINGSSSSSSNTTANDYRARRALRESQYQERAQRLREAREAENSAFDNEYDKYFNNAITNQEPSKKVAANTEASDSRSNERTNSADCEEAQSRGGRQAQDIERSAKTRGPSICASARDDKQLGQIMVEVAEACKNLPDWKSMRNQGQKQIREAERVISASCAK